MEEMASESMETETTEYGYVKQVNEISIHVDFNISINNGNAKEIIDVYKLIDPDFKLSSTLDNSRNETRSLLILSDNKIVKELPIKNNLTNELILFLDSLSGNDYKTLLDAYSLAGLWRRDKEEIMFKKENDTDFYINIRLIIILDNEGYINQMLLYFCNLEWERISSIKNLCHKNMNVKGYLNGMEIGPDANHAEEDETVVRNIYCIYCGDLITTSTYVEFFKVYKTDYICDKCKYVPTSNSDTNETRKYEITGTPEQLDTLEVLFKEINTLCNMGSSRSIRLFIDGDGAVRLNIKSDRELNGKASGYGMLKKGKDGYVKYLDLG